KVLGGESKVAELFLLGSPTLGTPTAYMQLKNGLQGVYARDLREQIGVVTGQGASPADLATNEIGEAANLMEIGAGVMNMASGLASGQGAPALRNLFGDLYPILCLGAGKNLSREETTAFIRLLPSVYQLMPGSIYCRRNPNWVVFDPFTTGYPAT